MKGQRRELIGGHDLGDAAAAVQGHARAVLERKREQGLPTCGDDVSRLAKLSALMEEVGEVARVIQEGGEPRTALRRELLDVATAAMLWAWAEK